MAEHSSPLPPHVIQQIRSYCRQFASEHDAGPETEQELADHLEEKCLRYLRGEEPVTPEDAFILAKEHFGSPELLRRLMKEAHSPEPIRRAMRALLTVAAVAATAGAVLLPFFIMIIPQGPLVVVGTLSDGGLWTWVPATVLAGLWVALGVSGRRYRRTGVALGLLVLAVGTAATLYALADAAREESLGSLLWPAPLSLALAGGCGLWSSLLQPRRTAGQPSTT